MNKTPIPFSSFGGYRRFCYAWWKDLRRSVLYGWWCDVLTYWQRARYGWAKRDAWDTDHYIAKVLGEMLINHSQRVNSAPCDYSCEQWEADLYRWGLALQQYATTNYYELHERDFEAWSADEKARRVALHKALKELEPWWESLWD